MKPIYKSKYITETEVFDWIMEETPFMNYDAPRDECFMSYKPMYYTYGEKNPRTYSSIEFSNTISLIMDKLNDEHDTDYDLCFLNYYQDEKNFLGWHADDSPEMDQTHPIAVVSFGAERDIWVKEFNTKGNVPDDDKYLLENGSLFIMPAGFQQKYLHRIPKHDRPCGPRIS